MQKIKIIPISKRNEKNFYLLNILLKFYPTSQNYLRKIINIHRFQLKIYVTILSEFFFISFFNNEYGKSERN